jgi:hypothetical protein
MQQREKRTEHGLIGARSPGVKARRQRFSSGQNAPGTLFAQGYNDEARNRI